MLIQTNQSKLCVSTKKKECKGISNYGGHHFNNFKAVSSYELLLPLNMPLRCFNNKMAKIKGSSRDSRPLKTHLIKKTTVLPLLSSAGEMEGSCWCQQNAQLGFDWVLDEPPWPLHQFQKYHLLRVVLGRLTFKNQ